ncbi:MAG: hypothetical protein J7578_21460 [Chitinophagaceae bacterium]|nr:hypothetical protein [Chitinophagaceae bacterium]
MDHPKLIVRLSIFSKNGWQGIFQFYKKSCHFQTRKTWTSGQTRDGKKEVNAAFFFSKLPTRSRDIFPKNDPVHPNSGSRPDENGPLTVRSILSFPAITADNKRKKNKIFSEYPLHKS